MKNCKACGTEMSNKAPTCPKCGHPNKEANYLSGRQVLAGFALCGAFIWWMASDGPGPAATPAAAPQVTGVEAAAEPGWRLKGLHQEMNNLGTSPQIRAAAAKDLLLEFPDSEEAQEAAALLARLEPEIAEIEAKIAARGAWTYVKSTDELTRKSERYARVRSANTFALSSPYRGDQRATLTVRNHPEYGRDVFLSIERGQIMCSSYDCTLRVAFDDEAPRRLTGIEPSSRSSEVVFLPGYNDLTRRMARAEEMRVQFTAFREGAIMVVFPVKGFNPELRDP